MIITVENQRDGKKVILEELGDDQDIYEMQEVLERLLLGMGYAQENIDEIFGKIGKDPHDI